MRQRTDRFPIVSDLTPAAGVALGSGPPTVSGEIWVGDDVRDGPAPRPAKRVVVSARESRPS